MTERRDIAQRFNERERERLIKLFSSLGIDNIHVAEAAGSTACCGNTTRPGPI